MSPRAVNAGVALAYEERGKGPPLLLVHGLGYTRGGWGPAADWLAERFHLFLLDNRGMGQSDKPPGPYTVAELAADAAVVVAAAGLERAHVVGTSLGGMVAQELALAHPRRVDRLVLACTTAGGARAYPLPEQTLRLLTNGATLREFVENALEPDPREELVERILEHRLTTAQAAEAWAAQAAAGATFDAYERVGSIAARTLVLHGDGDVVVDPRNGELLAELLADASLELFPGTGHLFFWQQPDRFVRRVEEFLL